MDWQGLTHKEQGDGGLAWIYLSLSNTKDSLDPRFGVKAWETMLKGT